jgi:hypothetical protein
MARDCKKPGQPRRYGPLTDSGSEGGPPDRINHHIGSVKTISCRRGTATECVSIRSDISNGSEMLLLVDTGADISLLKPAKLDCTRLDPVGRVRVKDVSGTTIRTLGTEQAVMYEGSVRIPFTFEIVDKRVDFPCDGILRRDFLVRAGANICYEKGTLTLGRDPTRFTKY